jgi:DNA mismatch endonuclease (patch repair protein)
MADIFTKEKRRLIMQSVRRQGTKPENRVAAVLKARNLTFEQQTSHLPGRPDFLFADAKTVLFVHGCFWHGHNRCRKGVVLSQTDPQYWIAKIERNQQRDRRVARKLRSLGYKVYTVWECQIGKDHVPTRILKPLLQAES